jgi:hypothetical protein
MYCAGNSSTPLDRSFKIALPTTNREQLYSPLATLATIPRKEGSDVAVQQDHRDKRRSVTGWARLLHKSLREPQRVDIGLLTTMRYEGPARLLHPRAVH